MKSNTIDAKLLTADMAISNASKNNVISTALAQYGYDETTLNEGKSLHEDAVRKQAKQKKEYGEQYEATDALDEALALGNDVYMRFVKLARIALKNKRGAAQALDLDGRRKQTYSGWIKQSNVFYTNSLNSPEILTEFGRFAITKESLEDGQGLVEDVATKLAKQLKEKGEAQDSTEARDLAFDRLEDWMSDFRAVARIALEEKPQMLEMLGIVEPRD